MKRLFCLLLALTLSVCLCACGMSEEDKVAQIQGTWYVTNDDTVEQAQLLLENVDFYPEEIALCDLTSLDYVESFTITADKNYRFQIDPDGTKACVKEFYTNVFASLYASRSQLNTVYEADFSPMTQAEFYQYYADLYEMADIYSMIDLFTENAYVYDQLEYESGGVAQFGSFSIKGSDLILHALGYEDSRLPYVYDKDADTLTLKYSNKTDVYTRSR